MSEKKGLSFFTSISTVICVVFVCEAAAPAAAIGNQQFFWWIFLIITFLIPYGLAVAELGTAYDSEGGLIDWIRDGLGDKWAARAAYYYWVNYPFWIASLATLFPYIMTMISGYTYDFEANIWVTLGIELAFTWIVTFMAFSPVSDSEWVLNGGAIIKVAVAVQKRFKVSLDAKALVKSGTLRSIENEILTSLLSAQDGEKGSFCFSGSGGGCEKHIFFCSEDCHCFIYIFIICNISFFPSISPSAKISEHSYFFRRN